jgi:heat shock protein HslJ
MRRMLAAALLLLGTGLSGCVGATPEPEPTLEPTPTDVALADWQPGQPSGELPDTCYWDAEASQPFGCTSFLSTDGSSNGREQAWLAAGGLRVHFAGPSDALPSAPGDPVLPQPNLAIGLATPCNSLGINVLMASDTLTPTDAGPMQTLMACSGALGESEAWASTFITRPMTFTLDGSTLVLRSGEDEVTFEGTPID